MALNPASEWFCQNDDCVLNKTIVTLAEQSWAKQWAKQWADSSLFELLDDFATFPPPPPPSPPSPEDLLKAWVVENRRQYNAYHPLVLGNKTAREELRESVLNPNGFCSVCSLSSKEEVVFTSFEPKSLSITQEIAEAILIQKEQRGKWDVRWTDLGLYRNGTAFCFYHARFHVPTERDGDRRGASSSGAAAPLRCTLIGPQKLHVGPVEQKMMEVVVGKLEAIRDRGTTATSTTTTTTTTSSSSSSSSPSSSSTTTVATANGDGGVGASGHGPEPAAWEDAWEDAWEEIKRREDRGSMEYTPPKPADLVRKAVSEVYRGVRVTPLPKGARELAWAKLEELETEMRTGTAGDLGTIEQFTRAFPTREYRSVDPIAFELRIARFALLNYTRMAVLGKKKSKEQPEIHIQDHRRLRAFCRLLDDILRSEDKSAPEAFFLHSRDPSKFTFYPVAWEPEPHQDRAVGVEPTLLQIVLRMIPLDLANWHAIVRSSESEQRGWFSSRIPPCYAIVLRVAHVLVSGRFGEPFLDLRRLRKDLTRCLTRAKEVLLSVSEGEGGYHGAQVGVHNLGILLAPLGDDQDADFCRRAFAGLEEMMTARVTLTTALMDAVFTFRGKLLMIVEEWRKLREEIETPEGWRHGDPQASSPSPTRSKRHKPGVGAEE